MICFHFAKNFENFPYSCRVQNCNISLSAMWQSYYGNAMAIQPKWPHHQGSLEETLRDLDLVARLERDIQRRIFPDPSHVINRRFVAAQKADVFLIGKVVEPAG